LKREGVDSGSSKRYLTNAPGTDADAVSPLAAGFQPSR